MREGERRENGSGNGSGGIGHPTLQSKVTLLPVIIRPIYIIYIFI